MLDDSILQFNRAVVQSEILDIADFIDRYQWTMKTSPTGLRYMKYKIGNGVRARNGATVSISYSIKLLNGDLVFKSDPLYPVKFSIGKREVTSGLEEGVLLMHEGDQMRLIVPSHLAFGLLGDLDKIPNSAVLLYDVTLNQVLIQKIEK